MFATWTRDRRPIVVPAGAVESAPFSVAAAVRLDNRLALCRALQLSVSEALTDEQLILQAYVRWGDRCCDYLLGAYSFVIWDESSSTLFCARDHVGCMPFYYSLTPGSFVFGTCIEDVLACETVCCDLDERFVRTRLANVNYVDNERTFYSAVRKLPAGHTLTVSPQQAQVKRYWFPENSPQRSFATDDDCVDALVALLQTVIDEQLTSPARVGVHLTGGLDSSTVAALATQILGNHNRSLPLAYCWLPPPGGESPAAEHSLLEQVRSQLDLTLRFQQLTGNDLKVGLARDLTLLPAAAMLFQEQLVMHQAQQDNIQILLSGWGGDELISFGGRGHYANLLRSGQWRRLWQESQAVSSDPFRHILYKGIFPQCLWLQQMHQWLTTTRRRRPLTHYLHPDFVHQVKPYQNRPLRYLSVRQSQLALLDNGHLSERIEAWATLGKRYNITYRYPLLDKRIIEFALGLPPEMFYREKQNRWLMRHAAAKLLPHSVAWNVDKSDPIRVASLKAALHEAFLEIGQQIQTQTISPSRASYLDMPRLLGDLSGDLSADSSAYEASGLRLMSQTLLFLDF
ncbi:MAG: asparagine synthase-related protein [Phormidesmis sp.]